MADEKKEEKKSTKVHKVRVKQGSLVTATDGAQYFHPSVLEVGKEITEEDYEVHLKHLETEDGKPLPVPGDEPAPESKTYTKPSDKK